MTQTGSSFTISRALALVAIVFLLIFSIAAIVSLQPVTMIGWWIPLSISFIIATGSGFLFLRFWSQFTQIRSSIPNFLFHLIFFTLFFSSLFYTLNLIGTSSAHSRKIEAVVLDKFKEKHHRTRRVGKNSYVRGPEYYVYYVTVDYPNGLRKNIRLPYPVYKDMKIDRPITLTVTSGLFGADVILTSEIEKDNPPLPEKRKRCRFFGTHG